ncbi:MAG: methylated-DNA--[protein]-cysteine S-methyltransferase [Muribaculaceae bacterium]|nr:methylated-DNA--[protein]-cysteine S-methyltransferase [Muribaculaceae bacterium]
MKSKIRIAVCQSPCGELYVGSWGGRLCLCDWVGAKHHAAVIARLTRALDCEVEYTMSDCTYLAMRQLEEYFDGSRKEFDMPLMLVGTAFQREVWQALQSIPYGRTESYSSLAGRIGRASSVRAVANANGANALSIFVPCHRIIGSDGSLTGYAGGLDAKRYLLDFEFASSVK